MKITPDHCFIPTLSLTHPLQIFTNAQNSTHTYTNRTFSEDVLEICLETFWKQMHSHGRENTFKSKKF